MSYIKKAYTEIIDLLEKHKDILIYDVEQLKKLAEKHLFVIELKEKYGYAFNLDPRKIVSTDFVKFDEFRAIGNWGEKHNRTLSWPDGKKQPYDEMLLSLSFPTGGYIFGDHCPNELFTEFWEELKKYAPKYTDTMNHYLLFSLGNGAKVFNEFPRILEKYREKGRLAEKEKRIKKLQEELKLLSSTSNK